MTNTTHAASSRAHWWLSARVSGGLAAGFTLAAAVVLVLPVRVAPVFIVVLFALHTIVAGASIRRHDSNERLSWAALWVGLLLTVPTSYAHIRYLNHDQGPWGATTVVLIGLTLAALALGSARAFRPLNHVPSTARPSRVGLAGFAMVTVATHWTLLGGRHLAAVTLGWVGAAALAVAFAVVGKTLHRLQRTADLMLLAAAGVYGVGQAALVFAHEGSVPVPDLFIHSLIATGLIAAATLHPSMTSFGEPIAHLSERRLTGVSTSVLVTISVADATLVAVANGPWSRSSLLIVLASVIAIQLVLLVWLSGMLMSTGNPLERWRNRRVRTDLRAAVVRDELEAHFQPIVHANDLIVAGYETLVRWHHPRRGLLVAGKFLEYAAVDGYLASIDHAMFRQAAAALPALIKVSGAAIFVTVNVDPHRLQQPGFAAGVLADLSSRGLRPRGLVVEVTESQAIDNWEEFRRNAAMFHDSGVGLAIDDFGAGLSNFDLLISLDPMLVKLDILLVEAAVRSERGNDVVRNAVRAARSAGAKIVAEGVSDPAWRESLAELGVDYLQGYAYGKAAPPLRSPADGALASPDTPN